MELFNSKSFKSFFATAVLLTSFPVFSALITKDLDTIGDGLLTLDTQSKLEWLDLSPTVGNQRSYNDMVSGVGGRDFYSEGFVHATGSQITNLYTSVGMTWLNSGTANTFNDAGADILASFGLFTEEGKSDLNGTSVFLYNQPDAHDTTHYISISSGNENTARADIGAYCLGAKVGCTGYFGLLARKNGRNDSRNYGHVLVRQSTSVPEPSIIALMGLGLCGLTLVRRRIKA